MGPITRAGRNCGPPGHPCPPPSIRYSVTGRHPGPDHVLRVTVRSSGLAGNSATRGLPVIPFDLAQSSQVTSAPATTDSPGSSPCRAARRRWITPVMPRRDNGPPW
jgi:hypothetical protein